MPIKGIAHVQVSITAEGEDRARFFYGSILGMQEVPKPNSLSDRGGVWFACGEQQLHCGVEDIVSESRRHVALITDDLDGLKAALAGAAFPAIVDRRVPGYRRFYTSDPFGNRLELMQPE